MTLPAFTFTRGPKKTARHPDQGQRTQSHLPGKRLPGGSLLAWLLCLGLSGCGLMSAVPGSSDETGGEDAAAHAAGGAEGDRTRLQRAAARLLQTPAAVPAWTPFPLPGKTFVPFEPVQHAGREALQVRAHSSVSILRQRFDPALPGVARLSFAWKADALPSGADEAAPVPDDAPLRVLLSFDGDRSRLSARTHRLSEMSRLLTGEELPYATLMYIWSPSHPVGTVLNNARSDRVRKLVLDAGPEHLGRWREHERDVRADFLAVFGEEPGPLTSVALMTDTDNTQSQLQAWYGGLRLLPALPLAASPR